MHVKPYHCHIEDTNISYLKIINDLAENPVDKLAYKEIPTPLNYLEPERSCQQGRLRKSHFTNNFINKTVDIFISHRERDNYKLALKPKHNRIITTPRDLFE